MRRPVRVVLADDHRAFVEGLGMVLSAEDDLEVVALAGDAASALWAVLAHRPDVLVVDTHMPGPGISELVRLVGQARPATRVLLLAEDARPVRPRRPGPDGHAGMSRAVSARELAEAIRALAAGYRLAFADPPATQLAAAPPAPATGQLRVGPRQDDHTELLLRSLSERERQILTLLARGYSNARIANTCHLSLNTVRTHVQNVLVKLGVHSKLEAAALAVRQGLISMEDHLA
jgi:DNA-binding NarL/FixJ family response regulator